MKLKIIFLLFLSAIFIQPSAAQSDKELKKNIKKAKKYYNKEKYEESAGYIKNILQEYPFNRDVWGFYHDALYKNYANNYRSGGFTVTITGKDGEESTDEAKELMEMLNMSLDKPKHSYYNALLDGVMICPYQSRPAAIVRSLFTDVRYWNDSVVSEKSKAYFDKAEGEFQNENFEKAITYYKRAYEEDSGHYKALLYIGDSYYRTEYYGKAAEYFRQAMEMQPMLLEPVKYLADAYMEKGSEKEALETLKHSFLVYPDEDMFSKLDFVLTNLSLDDKEVHRNWILRTAMINQKNPNIFREHFFDDLRHFSSYAAALEEVGDNYLSTGIRSDTGSADVNVYLEIESWQRMLNETRGDDVPALEYAREMDEKGMLAPYVFISLFNAEFYDQYRHFVDNNKALAEKYIAEYLIAPASEDEEMAE